MTRILVVEDEKDVRELLQEELIDAGFSVKAVKDGVEAIVTAAEQSFDLVLLDMLMPGLDGIQTLKVLQKIEPNMPIIGLTGYVGRGYMAQASAYGVTCLSKPLDIDELLREVNEVIASVR
ncbi:MAG: response regulator [Caldilineaceae bacterium]|nr:response regulator [Caldilineaceae bacterium]